MSPDEVSASKAWDAGCYQRHAGFVPALAIDLVDLLEPRPGERILDLGCGDGTLTRALAERGASVLGIDASASMVAAAQRHGVDARLGHAEALDVGAGFDGVFTNAVLHWVRDLDAAIDGVRRALRPGGRFVGEFGGHGNIAAIGAATVAVVERHGYRAASPWYFPTADAYRRRLEHHGFAVATALLFPRMTPLPTGLEGWLETFGDVLLTAVPPEERTTVIREVEEVLRPWLCDEDGHWSADYVRLRFAATRT